MKKRKIAISLFFIITLGGCSTVKLPDISSNKSVEGIESYVKGWPQLTEDVKYLNYSELHQKCGPHKPKGKEQAKIFGCSEINLINKTCTIFLPANYEQWALDHEKEHCKGGDHDNILQDYYNKWIIYYNQNKPN